MLLLPRKNNYTFVLAGKIVTKNLKALTLYILAALSVSVSSGVWGMDEQPPHTQINKRSYAIGIPDNQIRSEEDQRKKRKLDESIVNSFENFPQEIKFSIIKYATAALLDSEVALDWVGKLSVVSNKWQSFIEQHKIEVFKFAICQAFQVDEEICERFLNGKLLYKPNPYNDIGKVELRISNLANPLASTFNLSKCGDTGKNMSISTGCRKGRKPENCDKNEIWLVPRFLVEKRINGSASYFKAIFPAEWPDTVPVGIFWIQGNESDNTAWYDYWLDPSMDKLDGDNLPKTRWHYSASAYFMFCL